MYQNRRVFVFLFVVSSFISHISFGQGGRSPYTLKGLGDIWIPALSSNLGMGGLGLSSGSPMYLNNVNPALLPNNRITVFEAGLYGESREISSGENSVTNLDGGISYLALALPVIQNKWTFSFGLSPYSTVNYNIKNDSIREGNFLYGTEYSGTGGINQFYFSNGVKFVLAKKPNKNIEEEVSVLYLGVKATYLFGSIKRESLTGPIIEFVNDTIISSSRNISAYIERTSFSDFTFTPSLAYKHRLKQRLYLNTGAVYNFQTDVNAKDFSRFERRAAATEDIDTINNNIPGTIRLPSSYGIGISLERSLHWTIGADLYRTNWADYRNYSGDNDELKNTLSWIAGVEYTPDISSVNSYWKRVTYRAGVNQETLPYQVNGADIKDFGINFGVSLPVGRLSSLNVALKYGQRGSSAEENIKENYFRINLGVTFNDNTWFIRRKFD